MANYMDNLLADLRTHWGLDDEAVEFVKAELIKSFKNGLMRGRELARNPRQEPKKPERGR